MQNFYHWYNYILSSMNHTTPRDSLFEVTWLEINLQEGNWSPIIQKIKDKEPTQMVADSNQPQWGLVLPLCILLESAWKGENFSIMWL